MSIINNERIVSDITFATRFNNFLSDIVINDAMGEEELEYLRRIAAELLKLQFETAEDESEIKYLRNCHPYGIEL